jgi:hypothetical protein
MPAERHFQHIEGVAVAAASSENIMAVIRVVAGRYAIVCGAAVLFTLGLVGADRATEPFLFDQELVLDVRPMPPN